MHEARFCATIETMSIIQAIKNFFENIFHSNSPEVQKRNKLRKLESELRMHPSGIYKAELLQPNFAEALRILYMNLRPISKILDNTITSGDVKRNRNFEQELIITGYSDEDREILESLSYENRLQALSGDSEMSEHKLFDLQRQKLERIVADLRTPQFSKMNDVLASLKQLSDLCHFNFITPLQLFDDTFAKHKDDEGYVPQYQPLPLATFENILMDLYYLTADFQITMPMGNAILALNQLLNDTENDSRVKKEILQNLRRIRAVLKNPLDSETLFKLIRLSKGDPNFVPQKASYEENVCKKFAEKLQEKFQSDELHIRNELKNSQVKQELSELFPDGKMEAIKGYSKETVEIIANNSPSNFIWVVPLQILKTFLKIYYGESLRNLLNDVVVEGLFTNPTKKSNFSQLIYSLNDSMSLISQFENTFDDGQKYSVGMIKNYINDSHRDSDFGKKLTALIDSANSEAKEIIQKTASLLNTLHADLGDFLQDAKRSSSEIVTNLKSIMFSSRNRETTSLLELQFPLWKVFFEILKNYVIIKKAKKE